jgi:hypothetical protein
VRKCLGVGVGVGGRKGERESDQGEESSFVTTINLPLSQSYRVSPVRTAGTARTCLHVAMSPFPL